METRETVRDMTVGQKANLYPSRILATSPLSRKWLDPADVIYDAPGLGAQVERTEVGFTVRLRYGAGYPTIVDLSEEELQEAEYIPVDDFQKVGYLWQNS